VDFTLPVKKWQGVVWTLAVGESNQDGAAEAVADTPNI
jgi:hypothetical protein